MEAADGEGEIILGSGSTVKRPRLKMRPPEIANERLPTRDAAKGHSSPPLLASRKPIRKMPKPIPEIIASANFFRWPSTACSLELEGLLISQMAPAAKTNPTIWRGLGAPMVVSENNTGSAAVS